MSREPDFALIMYLLHIKKAYSRYLLAFGLFLPLIKYLVFYWGRSISLRNISSSSRKC
jgi:hypothetical protein